MNTHEGYSKKKLSNDNVLLAGGGDKSLADFLGGIQYVSASHKILIKTAASGASWTDLVTLGAMDAVTELGTTGNYVTWTKNGLVNNLTVPYATQASRIKYIAYSNNSVDPNTLLAGGGITRNYGSSAYWLNCPTGLSYGACVEFYAGAESLSGQFIWDVSHNNTSSTHNLYFRASNNLGWQNDWKRIAWASEIPTVNNASLTLQTAGTTQTTFYANDDTNRTFNVTCANIGAATSDHTHDDRYVLRTGDTIPGYINSSFANNQEYGFWIKQADNANSMRFTAGSGSHNVGLYCPELGWICYLPNGATVATDAIFSGTAYYATSAGSATTASKLSTVSKTAWGQTYWTSNGVPTSVSGNMTDVGTINSIFLVDSSIGTWAKLNIVNYDPGIACSHMYVSSNISSYPTSRPLVMQVGYGNVGIGTYSPAYKLHVAGDIYANGGWLRTSGDAGWYSETYGGGMYMGDSTYVRVYNFKRFLTDATAHFTSAVESNSPSDAAIEVRERGRGATDIGHYIANAPRIGFHWGDRYWANFTYFDHWFRCVNSEASGYVGMMAAGFYHPSYASSDYLLTSDGGVRHISTVAITSIDWVNVTNKLHGGNEFNIVHNGFSSTNFWFNYLPWDNRNGSASISMYILGDGNTNYADVTAKHFYDASDIRLKKDIKAISNIFPIREFNWIKDGSKSYGFIAQELLELGLSELVRETENTGMLVVNYQSALCLYLAQLSNIVEKQLEEINKLKSELLEFKKD